jgi:hypothetical protein
MDRNDDAAGNHRESDQTGGTDGQRQAASQTWRSAASGFSPEDLSAVALHQRHAHRLIFSHP